MPKLLRELRLCNYRAFANARLPFDDFTVLVGRNGGGKSTIVDALEFVREALVDSLPTAIDRRGGFDGVLRRLADGPTEETLRVALVFEYGVQRIAGNDRVTLPPSESVHTGYRLNLVTTGAQTVPGLPDAQIDPRADVVEHVAASVPADMRQRLALYGFELGRRAGSDGYEVKTEVCICDAPDRQGFRRDAGGFHLLGPGTVPLNPPIDPERLLLPLLGGRTRYFDFDRQYPAAAWNQSYVFATGLRACRPSVEAITLQQVIGGREWLERDGNNLGDVIRAIERSRDGAKPEGQSQMDWILRRLGTVAPDIVGIHAAEASGRRLLEFSQRVNDNRTVTFPAAAMSAGTLRAVCILTSLQQPSLATLIAIDEIEDSIHPAALNAMMDAAASVTRPEFPAVVPRHQVLVTTHSPEALSHESAESTKIRIVDCRNGRSDIYMLAAGIREQMKPPESVGRLLRANALWADDEPLTVSGGFFELPQ